MGEGKRLRGFAALTPERRREIAALGGKSVSGESRTFSKNRGIAAEAGRKGGQSVDPAKRTFASNRALAVTAGRKGGMASRTREN